MNEEPNVWIKKFVSGDVPFGDWGTHVNGWLDGADEISSFVLIRYEDLLVDARAPFQTAVDVAGLEISSDAVAGAVEGSTIQRMRQIQQREAERHPSLVGDAARGGTLESLGIADRRVIEDAFGSTMQRLGYRVGG